MGMIMVAILKAAATTPVAIPMDTVAAMDTPAVQAGAMARAM